MKKVTDEGYFLGVDIQYPENLHNFHNDLPFLPERTKIGKVKRVVANLHDKKEYVIHIMNLKQALYHGLVLKKVQRVIKFNQNVWLKPYVEMKTYLRKKGKSDFEKDFFKVMNNGFYGNSMENVEHK